MKLKLCLIFALLTACSSAPKLPACHGQTAVDIEAAFIADALKLKASGVCDDYASPSTQCPEYLAREEQYELDLKEFELCPQ